MAIGKRKVGGLQTRKAITRQARRAGRNPNPTPRERKAGKIIKKAIRYGTIPLDPRGAATSGVIRAVTRPVTKRIIKKLEGRTARKAGKPLARVSPKRKTPTR